MALLAQCDNCKSVKPISAKDAEGVGRQKIWLCKECENHVAAIVPALQAKAEAAKKQIEILVHNFAAEHKKSLEEARARDIE